MAASHFVYPQDHIQVVLANKVAASCAVSLEEEGYQVQEVNKVSYDDLFEMLPELHVMGIRSKTHIKEEHLEIANELQCIGCFCIGTDQVDLEAAATKGVPVFNSPFGNTRSVAELIISQIIQLARKASDQNRYCHQGLWKKTHIGCHEIRGKILGVVGYGHVGSQVSVLAEAMGMQVLYHDINSKLAMGNARQVKGGLNEILRTADFLTLHVPFTELTENMISARELAMMKPGSYLLNAARGKCVVLEDVAESIQSGHLAGAYFDVYPSEPLDETNPLVGLPNVILTPHIGGSTMEAQENIGIDVTTKIIRFINEGSTTGAVNFPECSLPPREGCHRIVHVHQNIPGVLRSINDVLCDYNIAAQMLSTRGSVGYFICDLDADKKLSVVVKDKLDRIDATIRTRIIYQPGMYSRSHTPEPTNEDNEAVAVAALNSIEESPLAASTQTTENVGVLNL